jgi:ketopantoate hydroxymethyltransferase
MNILDFQKMKNEGRKISMVTCYDYSSGRVVAEVEHRLHPRWGQRSHDDARVP